MSTNGFSIKPLNVKLLAQTCENRKPPEDCPKMKAALEAMDALPQLKAGSLHASESWGLLSNWGGGGTIAFTRFLSSGLSPFLFLGEGSPRKIDYRKKGTNLF